MRLALALVLVLASCKKSTVPASAPLPAGECMTPDRALIVVMSSPEGYLAPCGCTLKNSLGGIGRLAAFWAEQKRCHKDPVLVSTGNFLFDTPLLQGAAVAQDESKAKLLATIYKEMGVLA